jgi:hypothetical protein
MKKMKSAKMAQKYIFALSCALRKDGARLFVQIKACTVHKA